MEGIEAAACALVKTYLLCFVLKIKVLLQIKITGHIAMYGTHFIVVI